METPVRLDHGDLLVMGGLAQKECLHPTSLACRILLWTLRSVGWRNIFHAPRQLEFVATFMVARLTLQTRKLLLVGVATDRNASVTLDLPECKEPFFFKKKKENEKKPLTCPHVKSQTNKIKSNK